MNAGVRERVWAVMQEWYSELGGGSILMTWTDSQAVGGQQIAVLGAPSYEMFNRDGIFLAMKRTLTSVE
jgi:CRISPR-associated protein Cas2